MTSGTGLPSLNPASLSTFAAGAKEFDEGICGGAIVTTGVDVATEKATRPETTCPSGLINFQRAVMAPVSDVGNETTTMLSVAP